MPGNTFRPILVVTVAVYCSCAVLRSAPGNTTNAPSPVEFLGATHDIGSPALDRGLTGKPLRVGRAGSARGICVQAPARIELKLAPSCKQFMARIGMDNAPRMAGTASFVVLLDDQEAYRSPLLSKGMEPLPVSLALGSAGMMALVVEEAGIVVGDMADWLEPQILMADGRILDLSVSLAEQGFLERTAAPKLPQRAGSVICDVRQLGAKGDARADDTQAFEQAFTALGNAAHGVLRIPPGDYRITRRIELVLRAADSARSGITVEGEGQSVSNLLCDSPGGLFRLVDPACATQFNLRDFSIVARQENCGTALDFGSPGRGARNYRTLTIENVDIRGDNVYRSNYFSVGLDATGHWRPLFRNLVVHSSRQRGTDRPAPDNSTGGACGVRADWCYAPAFEHCYVWGTRTGYSILCRNAPEGPEDASFIRCTAVGCAVGIDIDTPIPEPQLLITGCHINCTEVGIRLRNRKFFTITDNLMYSAVPSETPYTDILVSGRSHCGLITGNIFHFAGRDVYRADPQSARVNVHITSDIRDVTVANNIFNAKGTTVLIESGARRVKADDNGIANAHAKPSKN